MNIEHLERLLPHQIEGCDFSFDVTCEAVPPFNSTAIEQVAPVTSYRKSYGFDSEEFDGCGAGLDRLLAVAKENDRVRGYVLVSKSWNNYASIDDFAVDRSSRRSGVGRLLMGEAVQWAVENALPGLRSETQSNNVPACRFYEKYGFKLGGFDRHLYDALQPERSEVALYWYLFISASDKR